MKYILPMLLLICIPQIIIGNTFKNTLPINNKQKTIQVINNLSKNKTTTSNPHNNHYARGEREGDIWIPQVILNQNPEMENLVDEWKHAGHEDGIDNIPQADTTIIVTEFNFSDFFDEDSLGSNFHINPNDGIDDFEALKIILNGYHQDGFDLASPIDFENKLTEIKFPEGEYNFSSTIEFDLSDPHYHKNIIIKGEGSDKTIFNFDMSGTTSSYNHHLITIKESTPKTP